MQESTNSSSNFTQFMYDGLNAVDLECFTTPV